jgi:hypothetical protein
MFLKLVFFVVFNSSFFKKNCVVVRSDTWVFMKKKETEREKERESVFNF